jgi:hypothetical protein
LKKAQTLVPFDGARSAAASRRLDAAPVKEDRNAMVLVVVVEACMVCFVSSRARRARSSVDQSIEPLIHNEEGDLGKPHIWTTRRTRV